MLRIAGIGKQREHVVGQRATAAGARQHLGDQAAARMRQQVQARARWQGAHERQRVADRAGAEGRMIERVDAIRVAREQLANDRVVLGPELAEGARRIAERTVDEHEHSDAVAGSGHGVELASAALQRVERFDVEAIDTGLDLAVDLLRHRGGNHRGGRILDQPGDDMKAGQQRLAHPAAGCAARGLRFEAGPAELRWHGDFVRRHPNAGGRAAGRRRRLRAHEVARVFGMQHQGRPGCCRHRRSDRSLPCTGRRRCRRCPPRP